MLYLIIIMIIPADQNKNHFSIVKPHKMINKKYFKIILKAKIITTIKNNSLVNFNKIE